LPAVERHKKNGDIYRRFLLSRVQLVLGY